MARLTNAEKEAICTVLNERLAGSPEDFASAIGATEEEGERLFALMESALLKLGTRR